MAEFGKLNFSVALNPTSAFPLDARCYFNSLALAKAAAATAESVGSTDTVYYYGMKLMVDLLDGTTPKWYIIQADGTLKEDSTSTIINGEGFTFSTDSTLTLDENNVLRVNTTNKIEANNMMPVTSHAVHEQIGNIDDLLEDI